MVLANLTSLVLNVVGGRDVIKAQMWIKSFKIGAFFFFRRKSHYLLGGFRNGRHRDERKQNWWLVE